MAAGIFRRTLAEVIKTMSGTAQFTSALDGRGKVLGTRFLKCSAHGEHA